MLGIILVHYNDWENLQHCIDSISLETPYRIYVVDNASSKNSIFQDLKKIKNVVFLQSQINGGYSYGNNLGLNYAVKDGCDTFLISNTDVVFKKESIVRLLEPLQNFECDIVGPKIILPTGFLQEEILGVRVTPIGKLMLIINSATKGIFFRNYRSDFNNKNKSDYEKNIVYGVSGCCFAFRKSVLDVINPFDENIFLYNEEWLLAEKCLKYGLVTMINPTSEIIHMHGATTKNLKLLTYKYFIESERYVISQCFPNSKFLKFLIYQIRKIKIVYLVMNTILKG